MVFVRSINSINYRDAILFICTNCIGEREMRILFASVIASMIVGFVQGTILLLGIDTIFSTHYFSFVNAFVAGIMSIAIRKFNL